VGGASENTNSHRHAYASETPDPTADTAHAARNTDSHRYAYIDENPAPTADTACAQGNTTSCSCFCAAGVQAMVALALA